MNTILLLPLIIPLASAALLIAVRKSAQAQAWLSMIGAGALFAASMVLLGTVWQQGIQVSQLGQWPAPFGITFVADLFSALMVGLTGLLGLGVAGYSLVSIEARPKQFGFYPLLHLLLMGVSGAFLTGDLFNLYVWFELLLITSFVLLVIEGRRDQLEGAVKYVTINLLASVLFLAAVGLVYGATGTLNMADLARQFATLPTGLSTTLAMLFLIAFGIKAAIFPLFFWLPASYHTTSAAIVAIFAGLLTKVGIYALVRVFTLIFVHDTAFTHTLLLVLAGLTMVTGVLGAVAQTEMRKLLSFHIVSQIGYLLMGLGLLSAAALAGTIFFLIHVILAKSALFLVAGLIYHMRGTYDLKKLGGLYAAYPALAVLFLIPALSLAGLPPFSGFWAKLALVQAGLAQAQYLIVAVSLGVSLLTLFSMTKIWAEAFWKDRPEAATVVAPPPPAWPPLLIPVGALAVIVLALGLVAEPVVALSLQAAEQLLDPTAYIETVLGGIS